MKRILIIKLSSMGDVLHALPVLSDIKQALGEDTQIDWITEPNYACLLSKHPFINHLYTLPFRKYKGYLKSIFSPEAKALKKTLKQEKYDAILDLQGLLKSAWVSRWAKGQRYGYDSESSRESWASPFYQHKISVSKDLHAVSRMRELAAKALGYTVPKESPHYALKDGNTLSTSPQTKQRSHLILFPFTTWESKHWPMPYWTQIINLCKEKFTISIAWGSPAEHEQALQLCHQQPLCQPTPDLTIEDMQHYLQDCHAFIGVDTGFVHLATALDIPGIALMGPTNKNKSGPLGKQQVCLDVDLPCRPCQKRICQNPQTVNNLKPACLAAIAPAYVFETLQNLMKHNA